MTLPHLLQLAGKATRGPWLVQGFGCQGPKRFIRVASGNCEGATPGDIHGVCKVAKHNDENNATYIAALSPEVVEALVRVAMDVESLRDNSPIDDNDRPYISEVAHVEFNRLMRSLKALGEVMG